MSLKGQKVGIIGSGLIGRSWAMLFAGAGYSVCLYDINAQQLSAAVEDIKKQLETLQKGGLLRSKLAIEQQVKLISTTSSLSECLKDAIYAQECVWESLEGKTKIFKELDAVAKPGQILASSTSTICPTEFTADLKHKEYCVVAHPVNPPFYLPLVELVPNKWTKPEVMVKSEAIMKEIGQVPVVLKKEVVGFALNRMQYALLAECWRLVKDDVIDVDGIDKIFTEGLGMRYAFLGPMEATHLNANGVREYCEKYNQAQLNCTQSMGPPPSWEGNLLDTVVKQLESKIPMNTLTEKMRWRDQRLAALAKLKREMNSNEDH